MAQCSSFQQNPSTVFLNLNSEVEQRLPRDSLRDLARTSGRKYCQACANRLRPAPPNRIDSVDHDRHLYGFIMRIPEGQPTRYDGLDTLAAVISLSVSFIRRAPATAIARKLCTMGSQNLRFMRFNTEVQVRMSS